MSLWRPRLEYLSLTWLISAYSRRAFRVVPGQLEALKGSWPPLLHVALAVAVAGRGWLCVTKLFDTYGKHSVRRRCPGTCIGLVFLVNLQMAREVSTNVEA